MKHTSRILTAIGLALLLATYSEGRYGGGSGGDGGGSKPPDKGGDSGMGGGNSNPGVVKGDTFGDLYRIVRNDNGEPILFSWDGLDPTANLGFAQPIAVDQSLWTELELDALPSSCYYADQDIWLVPLNEEGEVLDGYEAYTLEVELGRLNLARSPQAVRDAAYAEAIGAINAATWIENDACGRLTMLLDGEEKTIDSPRENLALYQKLMIEGYLPDITLSDNIMGSLAFLKEPSKQKQLETRRLKQAASFLSGAGDKGTVVSVDEIVYLNTFLEINDPKYFDFRGFGYSRSDYENIWVELLKGPIDMIMLDELSLDEDPKTYTGYYVDEAEIMNVVFGYETPQGKSQMKAFHAAVNDALQVLTFVHDRALPEVAEAVVLP